VFVTFNILRAVMSLSNIIRHSKGYQQRALQQFNSHNIISRHSISRTNNLFRTILSHRLSSKPSAPKPTVTVTSDDSNKYVVDVITKENIKYITERANTKLNPKDISVSINKVLSSSCNVTAAAGNDRSSRTSSNSAIFAAPGKICGESVIKELRGCSIAVVMNQNESMNRLLHLITQLQQQRGGDIAVLSPQQIVECTSFLRHMAVSPSSFSPSSSSSSSGSSNSGVTLQPFRNHSLVPTVASALCHFLSEQVRSVPEQVWSFEHLASILFNLKHVSGGRGTDGNPEVLALIQTILQATSPANVSLQSEGKGAGVPLGVFVRHLARAASGLELMPSEHSVTKDSFKLLADALQQYTEGSVLHHSIQSAEDMNGSVIATQTREMLSLFHTLKHHKIKGIKKTQNKELKAYMKSLVELMSSDLFQSLPITLENVYSDVLANLSNLHGRSGEEVALLKAIRATIKRITTTATTTTATPGDGSRPVGSTPSLAASCRAMEGIRGLSSADRAVQAILRQVASSIESSHGSLTADMLTSVFRGMQQ
jgi:hypothetical protein